MSQQDTATDGNKQRELATLYCDELDGYIKRLEPIIKEHKKISDNNDRLTLVSAILPIILASLTTFAVMLSEQYWFALINIGNAVLPILINHNKNKLNKFNECTVLSLNLTRSKSHITSLALQGTLKDKPLKEIVDTLQKYNESLSHYLQIKT